MRLTPSCSHRARSVKPLAGWEYARFYIISEPEICPLRKRPAVERPVLAHSVGHFLTKRGRRLVDMV